MYISYSNLPPPRSCVRSWFWKSWRRILKHLAYHFGCSQDDFTNVIQYYRFVVLRFELMGTCAAFQHFYIMRRFEMITFSFPFYFTFTCLPKRTLLDEKCHVMFDVLFSCFHMSSVLPLHWWSQKNFLNVKSLVMKSYQMKNMFQTRNSLFPESES